MPTEGLPLRIRSLGDLAHRQLVEPGIRLQVAAVFDRVVYLSCEPRDAVVDFPHPGMVVLSHPDIPPGPLNITLSQLVLCHFFVSSLNRFLDSISAKVFYIRV